MKKQYIRLNNNDEHLSIGNLFRIIKDISKNKTSALQTELFCILFDLENINDTTVNNYCVGCRSIGGEYKQIFLNKKKRYDKNKEEFTDSIISILNIIDGTVHVVKDNKIDFINEDVATEELVNKLYNIAKNDRFVPQDVTNDVHNYIVNGNYYEGLVNLITYIVLYKKQPLYEDELKKEVIDNILNDTSISSLDLQEFLSLKLREGINYDFSLKKLASKGNAYANFELGSNEYYGYVTGEARYDIAFKYLDSAAKMDHASANYMIGNMYVRGLIGSKSNDDLKKGYEYLVKSYKLGNVAASNLIGNMYYEGIYPLEKDIDKAVYYYEEAALKNFAFSLNNLGKIKELKGLKKEAYEYYLKSALLGESWACNKMGEYYRKEDKDLEKAFSYYNKALESNYRTLCFYAYYNLAKYFYLPGCVEVGVTRNKDLAIKYLEIASKNNLFVAKLELFYIAIKDYIVSKDKEIYKKVLEYKDIIEKSVEYTEEIRKNIEEEINKIKSVKEISLECLE